MTNPTLEQMKPIRAPVADGGIANGSLPPTGLGGWGPGGDAAPAPLLNVQTILWMSLTAVTMLFIAFTASYMARRATPDWTALPRPAILWANTIVLLASGVMLERAYRAGRGHDTAALARRLAITAALGGGFAVGQVLAWRQLAALGFFLRTNPHGSFFYLLTGTHGLHLLGGVAALAYALARVLQRHPSAGPALEGVRIYWHFLEGLWLYVFALLFYL